MRPEGRGHDERGTATVVLLAVAAVVLVLALIVGDIALYLRGRATAATAADAAALAAAPVTFAVFGAEGTPSDEAARFARLNGAVMVSCDCPVDRTWRPRVVRVVVAAPVDLVLFGHHDVAASSRAEFRPTSLADPPPSGQPLEPSG